MYLMTMKISTTVNIMTRMPINSPDPNLLIVPCILFSS